AIVNRTRDSFFDEGRTWDLDAAVLAGREAAADGADIIDVGGVKFAPGEPLPVAEEIDRVIPVIRALREQLPGDVLLSVDTFHAAVARPPSRSASTSSTTPPACRTPRWPRRSPQAAPRSCSPTHWPSRAASISAPSTTTSSRRCATTWPPASSRPWRPVSPATG